MRRFDIPWAVSTSVPLHDAMRREDARVHRARTPGHRSCVTLFTETFQPAC